MHPYHCKLGTHIITWPRTWNMKQSFMTLSLHDHEVIAHKATYRLTLVHNTLQRLSVSNCATLTANLIKWRISYNYVRRLPRLVGSELGKCSKNGVEVESHDLCRRVTLTLAVNVAPYADRARQYTFSSTSTAHRPVTAHASSRDVCFATYRHLASAVSLVLVICMSGPRTPLFCPRIPF